MVDKSKEFKDYLRHSVGPESGVTHTQYPPGTREMPGPGTPELVIERPTPVVTEADGKAKLAQGRLRIRPFYTKKEVAIAEHPKRK